MSAPTITLSDGTTTIHLEPGLQWADEHQWSATEQTMTRGLTGKPILHIGLKVAGRPITLRPADERSGWIRRIAMDQIQAWADTPGQRLTLTLRGTAHLVVFRHHDTAKEGEDVAHYSDPDGTDWVRPTLRFMTVPE